MATVTKAKTSRKRDLVRNDRMALEGGNRALVDFHVTPPFGRSMASAGHCQWQRASCVNARWKGCGIPPTVRPQASRVPMPGGSATRLKLNAAHQREKWWFGSCG